MYIVYIKFKNVYQMRARGRTPGNACGMLCCYAALRRVRLVAIQMSNNTCIYCACVYLNKTKRNLLLNFD